MKVTGEEILIVSKLCRKNDLHRKLLQLKRILDSSWECWHRTIQIHLVWWLAFQSAFKVSVTLKWCSFVPIPTVFAGLAIRDFWNVDDRTIVFVADPTFGKWLNEWFDKYISIELWYLTSVLSGNILNFNVGASVDLDIPRSFWSRLAGKYGNMFYWKEKVSFTVLLWKSFSSEFIWH